MQTCVKDGKVTIVMTYEEWQDLYPVIDNDRLAKPMVAEIEQAKQAFNEIINKELGKVPDYLRRVIELNAAGYTNLVPLKKEVVR